MSGDDLLSAGLWETVADAARRKGITRQSLNERVERLAADGLITVRREGRSKLINAAELDRAIGVTGDAFKEAAAETRAEVEAGDPPTSPALRDHQARAAQYTADLKYLDLEERLGRLVPADEVKEAGRKAAEAIVRIVDSLPTFAEVIAAAVAKDGAQGARGTLKEIARELRTKIAVAMGVIEAEAEPAMIEPGTEGEAPA